MVKEEGFKVNTIARMKHGELRAALKRRGWTQKQAADFIGMPYSSLNRLLALQWFPVKKGFTRKQEQKLLELTGKTIEELFPTWTREKDFLETPKVMEIIREATPQMLQAHGLLALPPGPDEVAEKNELQSITEEMLSSLPPKYQKVLRLHFWEEKTLEEISEEMKMSRALAGYYKGRAIRLLRHPRHSNRLRIFR